MLSVLAITIPIYACVAVGHVAVRRGLLSRSDMRVLTTFVISISLPCMLFLAIGTRPVRDILNPTYLAAYALGSVLAYAVGYGYGRLRGAGPAGRAFDGLGMSGSNSGFVGYPLLLLTLPDVAGLVLGLSMIVENLLVLPLMFLLAEGRAQGHDSRAKVLATYATRLTRNPLLIGLVAGLIVSLSGVHLPEAVLRTADLFSRAGTAVALFAIGGLLATFPRGGELRRVLALSLGKLLLHPLLVAGVLLVLVGLGLPALDPALRIGLLVTGALPIMSTMPVLAHPYGESEPIAGVLLVTTGVSFLTLSGLLGILTG